MNPVITGTANRPLSVITPSAADLMFWEHVPVDIMAKDRSLAIGNPHPKPNEYPNHKLSHIVDDAQVAGYVRYYYLAPRLHQEAYNWELKDDTSSKWPQLEQTWVLLRNTEFTSLSMTVAAPPAMGHVWTRIGEREQRTGDEITDGLFVVLQVIYQDITLPLLSQRIDNKSGSVVTVETRMVPRGTAGQSIDASGYVVEVEPLNTRWSISTKNKVGTGDATPYSIHRPWPWPPVLINYRTRLNVDGSYGFDYVTKSWDDVCLIHAREYWSGGAPNVGTPTTLGKTSIRWNGALLNINIPECLHPFIRVSETANNRTVWRDFPATRFLDWPASITVFPSVQPASRGGYDVVQWTVFSPPGIIG